MKDWPSAFGPAIGGTIGAGALWWFVNGLWTVNGVGWLERQVWPLNSMVLVALGGGALTFLAGLAACARQQRRAREIEWLCRRWGFRYAAQAARGDFPPMPLLEKWSDGCNRMSGQTQGVAVEIVDLTLVDKRGDSQTTTHQTVFLLPGAGLPHFRLQPRGVGASVLRLAGLSGLSFDTSATTDPVAAVEIELFNKHFLLTADEEGPVRALFTPAVMRRLNAYPEWSIESHGGQLALWRGRRFEPASGREDRLAEAMGLRAALLEASAEMDQAEAIPSLPVPVLQRQAAGARASAVGGCLGIPLGFFAGLFAFIALHELLGLKFEQFGLTMTLFFGCPLLGAALGAALGAILARLAVLLLPTGPLAAALGRSLPGATPSGAGWLRDKAPAAPRPALLMFCLVFAALGTIFMLIGLGMAVGSSRFAVGAQRTEGTVVRLVAAGNEGGSSPVVRYQVAGKTYEHQSSMSTSPPAYSVGEKVSVLYRPEQPAKAQIDSFVDRWLLPLVFGGGGSLFAVIGYAMAIHRWRRGKNDS